MAPGGSGWDGKREAAGSQPFKVSLDLTEACENLEIDSLGIG